MVQGSGVTVAAGAILTVESGVVVKFQGAYSSIDVNGGLNATGAVFTSYKDDARGGDTNGDGSATFPTRGDWGRISFQSGSSGYLRSSQVLYGGNGAIYQISVAGSSPEISASTVGQSKSWGIYVASGSPAVTGTTFSQNSTGGLYSLVPVASLSGNSFEGNSGVALRLPANLGSGVHSNSYSGNANNGMYLTGDVTAASTWTASNSPYVLEGNPTTKSVAVNAPLTIEPGAVI